MIINWEMASKLFVSPYIFYIHFTSRYILLLYFLLVSYNYITNFKFISEKHKLDSKFATRIAGDCGNESRWGLAVLHYCEGRARYKWKPDSPRRIIVTRPRYDFLSRLSEYPTVRLQFTLDRRSRQLVKKKKKIATRLFPPGCDAWLTSVR